MALPIGHRSGVPVRRKGGLSRITRRHGIPFYSPAGIHQPHDYFRSSETTLTFFLIANISGEIPAKSYIKGSTIFRLLLSSAISHTEEKVIPHESEQIRGETWFHFHHYAKVKEYHMLLGELWVAFSLRAINNRLSGSGDITFTDTGLLNTNALIGQTSIDFSTGGFAITKLRSISSITFSQSGTCINAGVSLIASLTDFNFSSSGAMSGGNKRFGNLYVLFLVGGWLKKTGHAKCNTSINFATAGRIIGIKNISGSSVITFAPELHSSGFVIRTGSSIIAFTQTAILQIRYITRPISGTIVVTMLAGLRSVNNDNISGTIDFIEDIIGCVSLEQGNVTSLTVGYIPLMFSSIRHTLHNKIALKRNIRGLSNITFTQTANIYSTNREYLVEIITFRTKPWYIGVPAHLGYEKRNCIQMIYKTRSDFPEMQVHNQTFGVYKKSDYSCFASGGAYNVPMYNSHGRLRPASLWVQVAGTLMQPMSLYFQYHVDSFYGTNNPNIRWGGPWHAWFKMDLELVEGEGAVIVRVYLDTTVMYFDGTVAIGTNKFHITGAVGVEWYILLEDWVACDIYHGYGSHEITVTIDEMDHIGNIEIYTMSSAAPTIIEVTSYGSGYSQQWNGYVAWDFDHWDSDSGIVYFRAVNQSDHHNNQYSQMEYEIHKYNEEIVTGMFEVTLAHGEVAFLMALCSSDFSYIVGRTFINGVYGNWTLIY